MGGTGIWGATYVLHLILLEEGEYDEKVDALHAHVCGELRPDPGVIGEKPVGLVVLSSPAQMPDHEPLAVDMIRRKRRAVAAAGRMDRAVYDFVGGAASFGAN